MIAQNRGGSERRTPNVGGMAPSRISIGAWPLQQVLDQGWFSPVGARCARRSGASHGVVPPQESEDRAVDVPRLRETEEERVVPRRGLEPPLHFYN